MAYNEERALRKLGKPRLIDVGVVKGTPAKNLKVGDKIMWNYGSVSTVKGIRNVSPKFLEFLLLHGGKTYKRRLAKDRLVAKA